MYLNIKEWHDSCLKTLCSEFESKWLIYVQQFQGWSCSNHHLRTMDQWRLSSLTGDWSESSLICITHILLPAEGQREREREETDAVAHTISVGYGRSFISSHSLTLSEGEKSSAHIHQTTIHHRQTTATRWHQIIFPLLKLSSFIHHHVQTCMWMFFNGKQNSKNIIQSHQDLEGLFFSRILWTKIKKFTAVFKMYLYKEC